MARGRGPRALGASLPDAARAALRKGGLAQVQLVSDWAAVVGPELAKHCQPRRLSFPPQERRDGTLTIAVVGPLALELQHMEPQLLDRVNAQFGYRAIERIRYVQEATRQGARAQGRRAAGTSTPIDEQMLAGVTDDTLRAALKRLGAAIATDRPKAR
jgi:hypothetical protein